MKFSIVTPTYNRAYILSNLIRSVFNQSYQDWELVILDDGSTDDTKEIVKDFSDKRIKYHAQENQGPSVARNLALKHCKGDWILYIDSHNELLSNCLDVLRIQIKKHNNTKYIVTKGVRTLELFDKNILVDIIDDSENYPSSISVKDIYTRKVKFDINGFAHSKEIIEAGYLWNEKLALVEDWDFFMQFADQYSENFLYINIPVFHYHQRFGSDGLVSNASYKAWAEAFEYIYQRHKKSDFMKDQTWYPNRVNKYKDLYKKEVVGEAKPPYLKYFPKYKSS